MTKSFSPFIFEKSSAYRSARWHVNSDGNRAASRT